MDRTNGEFVSAWPVVDTINWIKGVNEKGELVGRNEPAVGVASLICPSIGGGRQWNQGAYSAKLGRYFTAGIEWCQEVTVNKEAPKEGMNYFGGIFQMRHPPSGKAHGHLDAYDPVTGKKFWTYRSKYPLLASILATAGDLVFTGDPEGYFFALDARTGEKLWSFQTGSGLRGAPVSYSVKGRQYIAVPSGWGSAVAGSPATALAGDGKISYRFGSVRLCASGRWAMMWLLLFILGNVAAQEPSPNGERIFAQSCSVGYCHGAAGSAGRGPRLRGRKLERSYVEKVTRDGIPDSAMPGWKGRLSDREIAAVVDYIMGLASASDVGPANEPDAAGRRPGNSAEFAGPPAARRGQELFFDSTRTPRCAGCHALGGRGTAIGPDLLTGSAKESRDFIAAVRGKIPQTRAGCQVDRRRYFSRL